MKPLCESKAGHQASVTGWYAKEGLFASWITCIHRVVEKTPQAAEEMSSVPHVASTDSPKEQRYSLSRFGNPSPDNWEGANFSGLPTFSWCFHILLVPPATPADMMESPIIFFPHDTTWSDGRAGCASPSHEVLLTENSLALTNVRYMCFFLENAFIYYENVAFTLQFV